VANTVYGEPYITLPMSYSWTDREKELIVDYRWKKGRRWHHFTVTTEPQPVEMAEGSDEEFITQHFWGYTKRARGYTSEYEVEHPRWKVYPVRSYDISVDFEHVYGRDFGFLNDAEPVSVFLAEGSEIAVKSGKRLRSRIV
jgi:hypothetical protein